MFCVAAAGADSHGNGVFLGINELLEQSSQPLIYAVLTGDIVNSSSLDPMVLKDILQLLSNGAERFSEGYPGSVVGKLDTYGGDGWQLLMSNAGLSIRAALFLRAVVRSYNNPRIDTRIAIACGTVNEYTLVPERISQSTGEAFTESGRALKNMDKQHRMIILHGEDFVQSGFSYSVTSLLDELVRQWTSNQAATISLALLGKKQEDIADIINKSQPTVNKLLQRASWRGIEGFLEEREYRYQRL